MLSPWFQGLPLDQHGVRWIRPFASVAHSLDEEPAVLLRRHETASDLGEDGRAYEKAFAPFRVVRFGLPVLLPAALAFRGRF